MLVDMLKITDLKIRLRCYERVLNELLTEQDNDSINFVHGLCNRFKLMEYVPEFRLFSINRRGNQFFPYWWSTSSSKGGYQQRIDCILWCIEMVKYEIDQTKINL